jgi:light-regulated signal transduction histidine kinase (bacteriophytochrome)
MSGFSRALSEDYADELRGEGMEFLKQIEIASRKMGELIDGILTLSRSTRGELAHDEIDISKLVLELFEELNRNEPDRKVEWQVFPNLQVIGDARMIDSVLRNLIDNAWKFTCKSPSPCIRVYESVLNGKRSICVEDNGAGFDMAHTERLFRPFQRLHRQEEFPGIGIGLATVQRIIIRHGGEISATGFPGAGATFCFAIPDNSKEEPK